MSIRSLGTFSLAAFALAACHRPNADEHMSHMSPADMAVPNASVYTLSLHDALPIRKSVV